MTGRVLLLAAAFGTMLAVPVYAQEATVESCTALLSSLAAPLRPMTPPKVEAPARDTCRYEGFEISHTPRSGWYAASVVLRGVPIEPDRYQAVRMEARGVRFALHSGRASMDWLNRQQQVPFDLILDFTYQPRLHRAVVRELSLIGETGSRVSAEGVFEDVAVVDPTALRVEDERKIKLRSLRLHLDSRRFLLSFVLPLMVQSLPEDDPAGAFERRKREAADQLRKLLKDADPATVRALLSFITDFPQPRHALDVSLEAQPPIGEADTETANRSPEALAELLRRVQIDASYEGEVR